MASYPPDPNDRDIPFEGDEHTECIRCHIAPRLDELGYCGHCHWAARAEVEEGQFALRQYLGNWARFRDWETAHLPAAA